MSMSNSPISTQVDLSRRRKSSFELVPIWEGSIWKGKRCVDCGRQVRNGDLVFMSKDCVVILHARCVSQLAESLVHGIFDDAGARYQVERESIKTTGRWDN
jgi:hypothetical protein